MALSGAENFVNRQDDSVVLPAFGRQLLATCSCQRIEARPPVVLRRSPFSLHPASQEESLERGVERAFADLEDVIGLRLEDLREAVPMLRTRDEGLQEKEVQRAGEEVRGLIRSHRLSMGVWILRAPGVKF